jgi:hypothetical protein
VNDDQTAFVHPVARRKCNKKLTKDNDEAAQTPDSAATVFDDCEFHALGSASGKYSHGIGAYSNRLSFRSAHRCNHVYNFGVY